MSSSTDTNVKVLYVLGYPRSGTTILGNVIGEMDGFFHAGELRFLWERNLARGKRRCGCGDRVEECVLWGRILARLSHRIVPASDADPVSMRRLGELVVAWHRTAVPSREVRRLLHVDPVSMSPSLARYAETMSFLYHGIASATGARVIVDSSKWPSDAAILPFVAGVRPFVLHLVRDPRGVVYSRQRKLSSKAGLMPKVKRRGVVIEDALGWSRVTRRADSVVRHFKDSGMTRRYEDFVSDPRRVLDSVADLVGEPLDLGVLDGRAAFLGPNHTVGGNRSRFATGRVELREDRRWEAELRRSDRWLVGNITAARRRKYSYGRAEHQEVAV